MDSEFWTGLGGMAFVLVLFALLTVIAVVVIRQVFGVAQTKIATEQAAAAEESYRKLAQDATSAQQAMAEQLGTISASLGDLQTRVASMERMMREVD